MLKRYLLSSLFVIFSTIATVNAETFETQSPIYTDGLGRMHFMGKGGYSSVRPMQMGGTYSDVVNDAVDKYSKPQSEASKNVEKMKKEAQEDFEFTKNEIKKEQSSVKEETKNVETDITKVIKENSQLQKPAFKSSYTSTKEPLDASYHKGYNTNIPARVNDSKTIYTDDLGRLHFFGKANLIKE